MRIGPGVLGLLLLWALRLVGAVIAYYLVLWLLPALLEKLTLSPPGVLVVLVALLAGLAVLAWGYWWPLVRRRSVP